MYRTSYAGGIIGTGLSALGAMTATNDVLQTISLILTILGAIVSFFVVPLVNWLKDAKKDGKITADEVAEGVKTLQEGIDKAKDEIEKGGKNG